jgi:transposase
MPTTFRPYQPDQSFLLPPSPRDWLPEGHLAYFIAETVDSLDLGTFYEPYEGDGRRNQPFDPRLMVKVLVYAYATGTFSSRKIARKLEEDVAYRVLGAGNFPAHRTICEFRQRHLEAFQALMVQVVRIAREAGLVKLGTLVVDGTKVKANASKHKAMSYGRMREEEQRLREQIEELTGRASAVDAQEDAEYGEQARGDELPEELRRREGRLRKIQEAKARLEARQAAEDEQKGRTAGDGRKSPRGGRDFKRDFGVPPDKSQDNFTDPESRIMKTSSGGYEQCYNAQIAVDEASQLIVAVAVSDNAADSGQLLPLLDAAKTITGQQAGQVLADAGYKGEENLKGLEERGIDGYISLAREDKPIPEASEEHPATQRMAAKLQTEVGRRRYRRRKAIVEPVMGWIKEILGLRRFSLRGLQRVRGEWGLVCLAVNLKRLQVLQAAA